MAALLEEQTAAYPDLRRGEIIEGVVVGTDRDGILVDIGAKSEGVVPPHEMHCLQPEGSARLSPGDKVLVFVVQPESPEGQIILSLDRARGERGWRVLQDYLDANQAFEAYVTGSNKGGLLVNVEGVNAFVPLSQIVAGPDRGSPENTQRALSEWVGKSITLKVIELNRRRNRAILSERAAVQERRAAEKERLLQELTEGDVRNGRVTSIRDFGIFVDIGGADGLVHLSELSWERTPKSPHELFRVGDEVPVYVLKVDNETKKIALSVRRAQPERWEEIVSRYREGQIVPGQVTKLAPFGAFVRLEGPIEGLIHISELVDRRINHPKEIVDEGDVVPVKIVRIEYDRHRLGLSLRQARDKAEDDGWSFSDSGGVLKATPEALERMGIAPQEARAPEAAAFADNGAEAAGPSIEQAADIAEVAAEAATEVPEAAAEETAAAVATEQAEPVAEVAADESAEAEPEAVAEAEVVNEVETPAEPEAEPGEVAEAEPEEPAPEPAVVAEEATEVAEAEAEQAPEVLLEAEAEPVTAAEAEPEEPAPEPAVVAEEATEVGEAEAEPAPEAQLEAEAEPVTEAQAPVEPEAETAAAAEAETAAAAEAEVELEVAAEGSPEEEPGEAQPVAEEPAPAEDQEKDVTELPPDALNEVGESS